MNRIIVVARLTSLRAFLINSESAGGSEEPFSGISEIKKIQIKLCEDWSSDDYTAELARLVNSVVLETAAESWVFAIPPYLTRHVLPLLDLSVAERLEEVLLEDLTAMSVEGISQALSPPSCDRFGHQRGPTKQIERLYPVESETVPC